MGGYGSGNFYHWYRPTKKLTTTCCLPLSISNLLEQGLLEAGKKKEGYLGWIWESFKKKNAIQCCVDATDMMKPVLHVSYSFKLQKRKPSSDLAYPIQLSTTQLFNGGLRWWFHCPMDNLLELRCSNRVAKLFLPFSSIYFGCRRCHQLTYDSCQNSRRFGSLNAFMGRQIGWKG